MEHQIQKYYRKLLDTIADGVLTIDNDYRITFFNRAAESIIGVSRENAVGKLCTKVLRPNINKRPFAICQTLETHKPMVNVLSNILTIDKRWIAISINTALLKDSEGRVIGAIETFRDLSVTTELRRALSVSEHSFEGIITKSDTMLKLITTIPQIAESDSTVLITGASGTGKELLARAIHKKSPQKDGPFVAVNCGSLPDTLLESELFGYKAGAFTDAKRDKPGRFAMAQNGSIFLDEIGDISQNAQIRLLRVLEEKCYEPLGATHTVETNCRIIAATHRDLEILVREGKFREDLYYRINVIKVCLPKLSERREDIPLLIDYFIDRFNQLKEKSLIGIEQEALHALIGHNWHGNVRELENAIEHAFALCQGELIRLEHLPDYIRPESLSNDVLSPLTLKESERMTIKRALQRNNWRKMATARELGIDKNTLRRKIKNHGIENENIGEY